MKESITKVSFILTAPWYPYSAKITESAHNIDICQQLKLNSNFLNTAYFTPPAKLASITIHIEEDFLKKLIVSKASVRKRKRHPHWILQRHFFSFHLRLKIFRWKLNVCPIKWSNFLISNETVQQDSNLSHGNFWLCCSIFLKVWFSAALYGISLAPAMNGTNHFGNIAKIFGGRKWWVSLAGTFWVR